LSNKCKIVYILASIEEEEEEEGEKRKATSLDKKEQNEQ